MKQRTALILGASGLVGGELLRVLAEAPEYERVTVLVRRPLSFSHPKVTQQVVDFGALDSHAALFAVDDVFCCLGTTIKKAGSQAKFRMVDYEYPVAAARLAGKAGARQYLIVSSIGANAHSRVFYSRVKGEVEETIGALGLPALHILRPSLLLGKRAEARPGESIAAAIYPVFYPLLRGRWRKYRAITGQAVATAMYRIALRAEPGRHVYESDQLADIAAQ